MCTNNWLGLTQDICVGSSTASAYIFAFAGSCGAYTYATESYSRYNLTEKQNAKMEQIKVIANELFPYTQACLARKKLNIEYISKILEEVESMDKMDGYYDRCEGYTKVNELFKKYQAIFIERERVEAEKKAIADAEKERIKLEKQKTCYHSFLRKTGRCKYCDIEKQVVVIAEQVSANKIMKERL